MHDYRRILALVAFSETGTAVARRALSVARLGRAELAFLHLITPDPSLDGGYPPPSRRECEQGFEQAALRRLVFLAASLGAGEARLLARYGQPRATFSDSIADWRPDLVVAGDDPGFLDGRHDLLTLGRSREEGTLKRYLRQLLVPAGLLGGA
jgi:nucleotide-binding universal stress UspA family protein